MTMVQEIEQAGWLICRTRTSVSSERGFAPIPMPRPGIASLRRTRRAGRSDRLADKNPRGYGSGAMLGVMSQQFSPVNVGSEAPNGRI